MVHIMVQVYCHSVKCCRNEIVDLEWAARRFGVPLGWRFGLDDQKNNKNQGVQVISRAADVLRVLADESGGLSLGQIAKRAGLPRSTVQRIVSALSHEGLIWVEAGNGGIRLGPEIQRLAQASAMSTRERLHAVMQKISVASGETVDLAVFEGDRMRFVDQIVGSQRLRTVSSIGETFPLTTTANGKAALALMDTTEATRLIIAEFDRRPETERPITAVFAELELIRNGALARDENEHTEGVSALGYGVRNLNGEIFAISVPVPTFRFARVEEALSATINRHRTAAGL